MGVNDQIGSLQDVPTGQVATIVTHLEMLEEPKLSTIESSLSLQKWEKPQVSDYLFLFRAVGEPWLWTSRLLMSENEVRDIIHRPETEIHLVRDGDSSVGIIELDFREPGQCEIAFFGLVPERNGKGHGGWMMNQALKKAWRKDIKRVWLHTCTQDSPRALPFYLQSGFRIFRQEIGMMTDPRLTGHLPRTAAPHVPILS